MYNTLTPVLASGFPLLLCAGDGRAVHVNTVARGITQLETQG